MRIKINLLSENSLLKFTYKYQMQGVIYKFLSEKFEDIHDEGIAYKKSKFKPFNFSDIFTEKYIKKEEGIILSEKSWFYFSSPFRDIVDEFADKVFKEKQIRIGNNIFECENINLISYNLEKQNLFKCVSPITIYDTFKKNGISKTYYYKPNDPEFRQKAEENIQKKAEILNINHKNFEIIPEKFTLKNEKIIKYKNTVLKGWTGIYKINAEKEIKDLIMDWGIGSKNSQGFGMMEIL